MVWMIKMSGNWCFTELKSATHWQGSMRTTSLALYPSKHTAQLSDSSSSVWETNKYFRKDETHKIEIIIPFKYCVTTVKCLNKTCTEFD